MNKRAQFPITGSKDFKLRMLSWATSFNIFCFLDNTAYAGDSFECLLAAGVERSVQLQGADACKDLKKFSVDKPSWLFGHFGYELFSENGRTSNDGFAPGFFFEPTILITLNASFLEIECVGHEPEDIYQQILLAVIPLLKKTNVNFTHKVSKEDYLRAINEIRSHIKRGDCYELNYCHEFYSHNISVDPFTTYYKLNEISPNPFSAFYRVNDSYCFCASPERFMRKKGQQLISQPIKGTSRRDKDPIRDEENKNYLKESIKERSENVMIVDLVRNDLSKVSQEGSVHVSELFGIYSFPQVHQMISTINGVLRNDLHWTDVIEAAFPMGSMTGAPKTRVMELIEKFEVSNRGLFSGSIGYIDPAGDFDFNVVIRSVFYNAAIKHLSIKAGSGITFRSKAEEEYDESIAKAEAMMQVFK